MSIATVGIKDPTDSQYVFKGQYVDREEKTIVKVN